jgi:phospholipase/lecithinase/hemolysin
LRSRQAFVRQICSVALMLGLMLGLIGPATASISQIVAFGDSLSDTGNLFKLTSQNGVGGIPGDPYYNGRFSDGLLAVEAMGFLLDVPVTSYAIGGAQTGTGNQVDFFLPNTGVASQVRQYTNELQGALPAPNTLFFIWAGPNDFYTGDNMFAPSTAQIASSNLLADIQTLFDAGARQFFIPLMPDLSVTPAALRSSTVFRTAAHNRSTEFNTQLTEGIARLTHTLPELDAIVFDIPAFMNENLPMLVSNGFNTTDACYDAHANQVCANEQKYVFWDNVHPSAATDWLLGKAFVAATVVPEPSTWVLMGLGTLALATSFRKRHQA